MDNDFVNTFLLEAEELIELLEKSVLDLEKDMTNTKGIDQIFRVMHTLKGSSDMFGFSSITNLTHRMESLFDRIKEGEIILNTDILNVTFTSIDHLRRLLKDNDLTKKKNKETQEELIKEIDLLNSNTYNEEEKDLSNKKTKKTTKIEIEKYHILFKANKNLLNRGINILALFEDLAKIGKYTLEELPRNENEETSWKILLETDKGLEAIEDVFMFVLNDCEITNLTELEVSNKNDVVSENEGNLEEVRTNFSGEEISGPSNDSKMITSNSGENEYEYDDISSHITSRVSVDASKLDKLMNLVSELVTTNSQLHLINTEQKYDQLSLIVERIESLSRQFRDNTLSIRLVPINDLVVRFRRLVRDLSKELNKDVIFITEGTETELDKNIIDGLAEPLMHILRNAVDHGIETPEVREQKGKSKQGSIKLSTYHAGGNVYIQIQDDGAGLDTDKIKAKAIEKGVLDKDSSLTKKEIEDLIFAPGFSTAGNITQISGRGVGMDIVKQRISEIQGDVHIESEKGLGTILNIKLHQTISIIDSFMVRTNNSYFLIPNTDIEFCGEKDHEEILDSRNHRIEYNKDLIPFISLREMFTYENEAPKKEKFVVVNKQSMRIAIIVDEIVGEHQAVVKPLGQVFNMQDFLVGASILGDGSLAFMLDLNKLLSNKNSKEVKNEY